MLFDKYNDAFLEVRDKVEDFENTRTSIKTMSKFAFDKFIMEDRKRLRKEPMMVIKGMQI